jgi:putative transcriptional regulator
MMTAQKRHALTVLLAVTVLMTALVYLFSLRMPAPERAAGRISVPASSSLQYGPGTALGNGKFLVADRAIRDPLFSHAVILLVSYGSNGALGLVINHPTNAGLSSVLPEIKGIKGHGEKVYIGGPVSVDEMFVLFRSATEPGQSLHVFGDVYMSMSRTTLEEIIGKGEGVEKFRVYAGYAGWAPGQLEREVARGDWHVVNADAATVFDRKADAIWPDLIGRASAQWVKLMRNRVRFL